MTAPNTGGGGIQSLMQTILTIKQLQHQEAADQLAREQFGVQRAATTEQMLGHLGVLASSVADPKVFKPHAQTLSDISGIPVDVLNTVFDNATPTADVTKAKLLKQGVDVAGPDLAKPAAYANFVGQQPGQLAGDAYTESIMNGAKGFYSQLPPEAKATFDAQVASKHATGMSLEDATMDALFVHLPQEAQLQALAIAKRMAPDATAVEQQRIAAAQVANQANANEADAAYKRAEIAIARQKLSMEANGPKKDAAIQLLKMIQDQQAGLIKGASILTPEGLVQQNAATNALYEELKRVDPEIGAIFERKVPLGTFLAAPGPWSGLIQGARNERP